MATLSYIIWNGNPEIFSVGSFALRWYGLFFALGFLISQQILYYMFRKEGKPEKDVDTLTIYMIVATIIGARLGHVLFYQPEIIWQEPLSIFLPFEFSPFKFTGLQGLASHGGAIGILFALWLYSRKRKPGQNYFQILDRIVILVALTGALIRLGNFFNSEIIGTPTDKPWGIVFTGRLTESLKDDRIDPDHIVKDMVYVQNDSLPAGENGRKPITIYIFFKPHATEAQAAGLLNDRVVPLLSERLYEYFDETPQLRLDYKIAKPDAEGFVAKINTVGIARHPGQLYEAISCVILFLVLFAIWNRHRQHLVTGRIFGIFLVWCFGMRIVIEFLKENQEAFEDRLPINMGQILSIPLVVAGIIILIYTSRKKEPKNT
ncbi:prolipoprotein diacylglyceryl transferase [Fulvivirgaceae bacterium PWU5]|uniref:Phosphatidylglycerol--prolipoprotein diacylglyceryl transferase n=1 Tax=Dawidia cretensis TaxID=2782350 RepID=A0AAP2DXB4_9BACT|nr:prolipoprotein diacylglyceryl transferase [Dawidia cretensis]MBT1709340.1 prolipoprotein diacylglyceryl transferase [Dawidia cretensis]